MKHRDRRGEQRAQKSGETRERGRENGRENSNKSSFRYNDSSILSCWSIMTLFINTRALSTFMGNAIWRSTDNFHRVMWRLNEL